MIEEFAAKVSGKADVWYATNIEICDYVNAWKRMITSADGTRVFNPNSCPIWLWADGKTYQVDPVCQITLD